MESQVRQNYHRECEAAINRMVNMELYASYTYTSMVRKTTYILTCEVGCVMALSFIIHPHWTTERLCVEKEM